MKNNLFFFLFFLVLVSCLDPNPRKPVTHKTSSFFKESVSLNKIVNTKEENAFKKLMKLDSLHSYKLSPSGFWYTFDLQNEPAYFPKAGDELFFTYEVYDLNHNLIYGFEDIGEKSYITDQQEIVEGLRNGLKLMGEGDKVTFLFPSHKLFGYLGDENKIGINQPLIYKVQLNKIKKKNESN